MRIPFIFLTFLTWLSTATFADTTEMPRAFKLCKNCHTVMAEGQHRKAPSLDGIVGREIASLPDFEYSQALKEETGVWSRERLDTFLQRPNHAQPGTNMYFRGLRNPVERKLLIDWLASASVPSVISPDPNPRDAARLTRDVTGVELFRPCMACHHYTEDEGIKIGPNLFGIMGREIASTPDFEYSEQILRRKGLWTRAALHDFFTARKASHAQGSHQAFRTLGRLEDREKLIDFLETLTPDGAPE